jgi:hypothetical protein
MHLLKMRPRSGRHGNSPVRKGVMILLPLVLVTVGVSLSMSATGNTTQEVIPTARCGIPASILQLANQVQNDPRFVYTAKGMSYALQYSYTQGPETGVMNSRIVSSGTRTGANGTVPQNVQSVGGTPIYYPPSTVLVFFSYGSSSVTHCVNDAHRNVGVLGVIYADVPQGVDGSSNLASMTLDFSPGLIVNGTTSQSR